MSTPNRDEVEEEGPEGRDSLRLYQLANRLATFLFQRPGIWWSYEQTALHLEITMEDAALAMGYCYSQYRYTFGIRIHNGCYEIRKLP